MHDEGPSEKLLSCHKRGLASASDRDLLTPSVLWNIGRGIGVWADDYLKAEEQHSRIWANVAAFFNNHDLLLCATTSIAAFRREGVSRPRPRPCIVGGGAVCDGARDMVGRVP